MMNTLLHPKRISYRYVFLIGIVGSLLIFLPFILWNGGIFIFAGDFNVQQIPFYQLAGRAVQSGNLLWNWNTDLGVNFLGTYSFYLAGSPFFWLTSLLPSWLIPYLMGPLLMTKIALSGVTAFAFIRRFTKEDKYALLGALVYAFSGFSVYNIFFNHFHEVILTFPLLLLSLELAMTEGKRGFFAAMVALCAVTNYFFFAGEVVFLILYFVIRVASGSYSLSWGKFGHLALESLLGVGLSAILLLPAVMAVLGNPRLSSTMNGYDYLLYSNPQKYASIWMNLFFPSDVPYAPNFFTDADVKWKSISAFLPMFSMCGVFAYCKANGKSWIKRVLIACLAMAMVPWLNSAFVLFNSSYYARWFYMPVLIMALASAKAFEDFEEKQVFDGIRLTAVFTLLLCVFAIVPTFSSDGSIQWFALCEHPARFWVMTCVAFLGICLTSLVAERRRSGYSGIRLAVSGILVCAVLSSWVYMIEGKNDKYWDDYYVENCLRVTDKVTLPTDDNFIRYDFQGCEDNQGMFFGVPTIQAFNSVVPASILEFYPYVDVTRDVSSKPEPSKYGVRGLTSVKYLVHNTKDEYKEQKGFVKIDTQLPFDIYENTNYVPMGFTYDYLISRSVLDGLPSGVRAEVMMEAMCIQDADLSKVQGILKDLPVERANGIHNYDLYVKNCGERRASAADYFKTQGDGFVSQITLDKENLVFFSVPYDKGWSASVNGKPVEILKANVGFMAVACAEGTNDIVFTYTTPGLKAGAAVTGGSAAVLLAYWLYYRKKGKMQEVTADHE